MSEHFTRRAILRLGGLGIAGVTGCVEISTNPRGRETPTATPTETLDPLGLEELSTETPTPTETETPTEEQTLDELFTEECTSAYVTDFEWESGFAGEEDYFYGTVINQADIAGELIVQLIFYEDEAMKIRTGTTRRTVAISAQEAKDILIRAHPPTDDSNWAVMSVDQQACTLEADESN